MTTTFPTTDLVVLVNDQDHEIGVMDKVEAHRGAGKLHRAISVFLFNDHGELLVQQRSRHKIVGAGQWANTCCGNVRPGESYEACAQRRLREELGIEGVVLKPVYKFKYAVHCNDEFSEREMDQVFVGRYNDTVSANPLEVVSHTVVPLTTCLQKNSAVYNWAPWFEMMMADQTLISHLRS